MKISLANFEANDVLLLIRQHLKMSNQDACTHALGLEALQKTDIQMFTARNIDGALMGCAALKCLNDEHGEIKSVRTHDDFLRKGVSSRLMAHIEQTAKAAGMTTLYLETHNTPQYDAACKLYEKLGYHYCGPFGDYTQNPRNVFMQKALS